SLNATGLFSFGWFTANSSQPVSLTQVTAASLGNGNLVAFALGTDQRAYQAIFDPTTGTKVTGWTQLTTQLFSQLSAGSQANKTKLYGVGAADQQIYAELFDAAGGVQSGVTLTAPGRFLDVAQAAQS